MVQTGNVPFRELSTLPPPPLPGVPGAGTSGRAGAEQPVQDWCYLLQEGTDHGGGDVQQWWVDSSTNHVAIQALGARHIL